jgi:putative addiction module killer protein
MTEVRVTVAYLDWINGLRDHSIRGRIQVHVDRLVHGHRGAARHLRHGVSELRIDAGPGYRVYFADRGGRLLVLLAGGDKSTQSRDIARAIHLARNWKDT